MATTGQVDDIDLDNLDYISQIPYNGTDAQGANPLEFDVNLWYNVSIHDGNACARSQRPQPHLAPAVSPSADHSFSLCPQAGDIAWIITSTGLVLLMIPGVG